LPAPFASSWPGISFKIARPTHPIEKVLLGLPLLIFISPCSTPRSFLVRALQSAVPQFLPYFIASCFSLFDMLREISFPTFLFLIVCATFSGGIIRPRLFVFQSPPSLFSPPFPWKYAIPLALTFNQSLSLLDGSLSFLMKLTLIGRVQAISSESRSAPHCPLSARPPPRPVVLLHIPFRGMAGSLRCSHHSP